MVCDSEEEQGRSKKKVGWRFCHTKWVDNSTHSIPYKNPSCFAFRWNQSVAFILCVAGMSPHRTVLKVVPSLAPQLTGIHPCPLYSSRLGCRCFRSWSRSSTAARAFIVDIELTKSCAGPTLMLLGSVEVFVRPSEVHVIFCKSIGGKITHISSVCSPDHYTSLKNMSLRGRAKPPPSWSWSPARVQLETFQIQKDLN